MSGRTRERRNHSRHEVPCPVTLHNAQGAVLAQGQSVNLSDGGTLTRIPIDAAPPAETDVLVRLALPRTTPNTYMLEEVRSFGRILRCEPSTDGHAHVAVVFVAPLSLMLDS